VSSKKSHPASREVRVFGGKLSLESVGRRIAQGLDERFAGPSLFCETPLDHMYDGSEVTGGRR
jgi:hypothetical protein